MSNGRLDKAASTFDTLAATRALEAAGVERKQAEAHAEWLRAAAGADLGQLATKANLEQFGTWESIAGLQGEFRIVKWVMAFLGTAILAMAGRLFGIPVMASVATWTPIDLKPFGLLRILEPS